MAPAAALRGSVRRVFEREMSGIQRKDLGLGRITNIGSAAAGWKDLVVPVLVVPVLDDPD
jgi:hypothetical protein